MSKRTREVVSFAGSVELELVAWYHYPFALAPQSHKLHHYHPLENRH